MAIETFSIELEALLADFLQNLNKARQNLLKIQTAGAKVASEIDKSFADIRLEIAPEGIEQTEAALGGVTEKAKTATSFIQTLNDNFGAIRSTVVTLGKTLELLGQRLNIPVLENLGLALFTVGKQVDNSSDAFGKFIRAFKAGDIDGIADSFKDFAFVIRNIGQLLVNLGKRLQRLALLGSAAGKVFGLFSARFAVIGKLAPILGKVGKALEGVGTRAKKTAGFLGDLNEELPAQDAVRSTSTLAKLGRVIRNLLKVVAVIGAFKGLKIILKDIAVGGARTGVALTTLGRAAGLGISSVAGLASGFAGAQTPLGRFLGQTDKITFGIGRLAGSLTTLARTESAQRFAQTGSVAMQRFEDATVNIIRTLPGVELATRVAQKGVDTFKNTVRPAVREVGRFTDNVIGLSTGTVGLIPGVNRVTKVVKKSALAAGVAATAFGGGSAAVDLFAKASFGLIGTIAGLNAILIGLGVLLDSIGKKLINTVRGFAKRADEANLAFQRLENTIIAQEAATGIALGTIEDFRLQAQALSAATGQSVVQIAKLQSIFVGLNQSIKLPTETLSALIEETVKAGTSIGDLGGSVIAVKDAFIGILRPLLLRFGATIKAEEVDRLAAEAAAEHGEELASLSGSARKAATSLVIAELVLKALGPAASVAEQAELSLRIETGKLAAAQDLVARTVGERAIPTLAALTLGLRKVVEFFTPFIEATAGIIAPLITLSGVFLRIIGTLLKFGTIIAIASNGFKILNGILGFGIKGLGSFGGAIRRATKSLTGQTIAVRDASSLFRAFAAIIASGAVGIVKSFANIGKSVAKSTLRFVGLKLSVGPVIGLFGSLFRVITTGIKTLFTLVKANALVIGKFTIIIAVVGLIVAAVVKLFQKYGLLAKITATISRLFGKLFKDGGFLTKVFEKLGTVVEILVVGAFIILEGFLFATTFAVQLLAETLTLLLKVINAVTFNLFGFGDNLVAVTEEISKTAKAARDELAAGFNDTLTEATDLGKELVGLEKRERKVTKSTEEIAKAAEATAKRLEQLKIFAGIAVAGIDESLDQIVTNTDRSLEELQATFDLRSKELAASTGSASRAAINELEKGLISDVGTLQQEALSQAKRFIEARRDLQLSALKELTEAGKVNAAEQIQNQVQINTQALQSERDFAIAQKTVIDGRIQIIKERQAERVKANIQADEAIKNARKSLNDEIASLQLSNLVGAQRAAFVRQQVAVKQAQFEKQLAAGQTQEALKTSKEITDIQKAGIQTSKDTANLQAAAAKIGLDKTESQNRETFRNILKRFKSVPPEVRKAFTTLQQRLRRSGISEVAKEQAEEAAKEFKRIVAGLAIDEQVAQLQMFQAAEQQRIDAVAAEQEAQRAKQEENDQARLTSLQEFSAQFAQVIDDANAKLADPKKLIVEADLSKFNQAIAELQAKGVTIPVTLKVTKSDVPNASIVPIEKTEEALESTIRPTLTATVRTMTEAAGGMARAVGGMAEPMGLLRRTMDTGLGGIRPLFEAQSRQIQPLLEFVSGMGLRRREEGSSHNTHDGSHNTHEGEGRGGSRTVRVDINMGGGERMPVNVVGDEDADNLVRAIRRTNRTRGNFRSPYARNA